MFCILLLGFSSGIPLALVGSTLQAWMKDAGVDLGTIGVFSLVGLPYTVKFLWAPLMDRYIPPFFGSSWGRRRGWMFVTQLALIVFIAAIGFVQPAAAPAFTALAAVLVAFFSASQDIVVDAYKIEVLNPEEFGAGAAVGVLGYRLAMIVSGAGGLILADHLPWRAVYLVMAAVMGIGALTSVFAPEPSGKNQAPKTLKDAVVLPFMEFLKRNGAIEMIAFMLLYKIDVVLATSLTTPFMMELGFTKTDIGAVTKGLGLVATLVGTVAGGALMIRLKMLRSLWTFGLFQGVSTLTFMLLAHVGHNYPIMADSIALENFCSGMGNAAYAAFIMSICDKRFTATQYALFTSLMAVTRVVAQAPTGFMVKAMGWEPYFLFCTFMMLPGLLLLTRYKRWVAIALDHA